MSRVATLSGVSAPESSAPVPANAPIYLIATAGHPNFGDEFVTASWLRFLAKSRPEADIWLDSPNPGLVMHLFEGCHPRLRVTNNLWRLMAITLDLPADEANARVDEVVLHLGSPQFDIGLLAAREARTVHVIGGGYINSRWPGQVRLLRAALRLKEVSGARLLATGLGLMPMDDADEMRRIVERFDHFSVRDAPSAELTGATLSCDDAFLGLQEVVGYRETEVAEGAEDEVWVDLQSDVTDPGVFDAALEALKSALTSSELSGRTVRYLEAIPGVDRTAFERLGGLIPEENFVPFVGLWKDGFPARRGQTWITSRFHFHLLAAACGARGTALVVNDDYYAVKHQSLLDAGTGWSLTPALATTASAPSSDPGFRDRAESLKQSKLQEAESLYPTRSATSRRRGGGFGSNPRAARA